MPNITGSKNDDRLHGTAGNDTINGRGGNDMIWGEKGDDALYGGNAKGHADSDQFIFGALDGHDVIRDWNTADDTIVLTMGSWSDGQIGEHSNPYQLYDRWTVTTAEGHTWTLYDVFDDVVLAFDEGYQSITIENVEPSDLSTSDFWLYPSDYVL